MYSFNKYITNILEKFSVYSEPINYTKRLINYNEYYTKKVIEYNVNYYLVILITSYIITSYIIILYAREMIRLKKEQNEKYDKHYRNLCDIKERKNEIFQTFTNQCVELVGEYLNQKIVTKKEKSENGKDSYELGYDSESDHDYKRYDEQEEINEI